MSNANRVLSVRIPEQTRTRLNHLAKKMRRSRSALIVEALNRHLEELNQEHNTNSAHDRFADIMQYKGIGASLNNGRSAKEIDASIREFRGDD